MSDHKGVRVIDGDVTEAAKAIRAEGGAPQRKRPAPPPLDDEPKSDEPTEELSGLAASLGREIYTWTSPFNEAVVVKFRRPRAGTDERVARLLDDKSENATLSRRYKALLSIVELNGKPINPSLYNLTKLHVLRDQIGFVGPGDDDVFDEPINTFTTAFEFALYPDQIAAIADAQGVGLSPEDIARIAKNAGLDRPKG